MAETRFIAKAILLDSNDDFLLLQRSDSHPRLAGFYDLPGGMIEKGEEPGDAVLREIKEETSLEIDKQNIRVLYATTKLISGKSFPTLLYVARIDASKPHVTISWEHKTYDWAPLDKLQEVEPQLASTYREALNYIRANDILSDIFN
jgi:8-oxo-dGTP diphosphatase